MWTWRAMSLHELALGPNEGLNARVFLGQQKPRFSNGPGSVNFVLQRSIRNLEREYEGDNKQVWRDNHDQTPGRRQMPNGLLGIRDSIRWDGQAAAYIGNEVDSMRNTIQHLDGLGFDREKFCPGPGIFKIPTQDGLVFVIPYDSDAHRQSFLKSQ
jgi:hypothetical protein